MIPEYADDLDFENRLPPGQAPIMTTSVKRFHAYMNLLMQSRAETGYATMGAITGDAGVGKTIAIQTYVQQLTPRTYSGFPACVNIKVSPRSTAKALGQTLLSRLSGRPSRHNIYQIEDASTEAVRRSDLDLILVDEGDWLNVESFEFLRHVFDRTGCPIVIVGLPHIMQVIAKHEKFSSRVGLQMEFLPLTQEEVLTTVLPALTLPYWQYDVTSSADREVGILLWERVAPSFRKLRVVLQYASQIARARQAERITPTILKETFRLTLIPHVPPPRPIAPADPPEEHGPFEIASEQKPPRS
jgi:DNA transposition AAA+ family ATPase